MMNLIARGQSPPPSHRVTGHGGDGRPDKGFKAFLGHALRELVDVINPLQHLPLVSGLYRAITGDEISPVAKLVGGAVFGGPLGAGVALVEVTGDTLVGHDIAEAMWRGAINRVGSRDGLKPVVARDDQRVAQHELQRHSLRCASTMEWLEARVRPMTSATSCPVFDRRAGAMSHTTFLHPDSIKKAVGHNS